MLLKLLTVSKNANSFGLHSCIFIGTDGRAYQGLRTAQFVPKENETYKFEGNNALNYLRMQGYECADELATVPEKRDEFVAKHFTAEEIESHKHKPRLQDCSRDIYADFVARLVVNSLSVTDNARLIGNDAVMEWMNDDVVVAKATYSLGGSRRYQVLK